MQIMLKKLNVESFCVEGSVVYYSFIVGFISLLQNILIKKFWSVVYRTFQPARLLG